MTDLERCDVEIARCLEYIMAGGPDFMGAILGLLDWSAERRVIVLDEQANRMPRVLI